jgi:hypothetical protein
MHSAYLGGTPRRRVGGRPESACVSLSTGRAARRDQLAKTVVVLSGGPETLGFGKLGSRAGTVEYRLEQPQPERAAQRPECVGRLIPIRAQQLFGAIPCCQA